MAQILDDTGTFLELRGENPFKVRAYHNGARALRGLTDDIGELIASGKIIDIKGIGKGLASAIGEIHATGTLHEYDRLRAEVPPGMLDLITLPGIGPKKAKHLYDTLGIESVGELEYACHENRLAQMKGFGAKSQASVLAAIEFYRRSSDRFLFSVAIVQARILQESLGRQPGIARVEISGELRRCCETVGSIVMVAQARSVSEAIRHLQNLAGLANIRVQAGVLEARLEAGMPVEIHVVTPDDFARVLLESTGSTAFIKALRLHVGRRGVTWGASGLQRGEEKITAPSEPELFKKLGLVFVPSELRESESLSGLLRARGPFKLIERSDVRGVFHAHTTYSDGAASVADMAAAARKLGFCYLGISDHSQSAVYAHGLKKADIKKQRAEIAALNAASPDFRILHGIEADILQDGSLDYDAATLNEFDFVIASVHSRFKMDEKEMTERLVQALKNPHTTMLGHMTGRLLLTREAYGCDVRQVIDAAAEHGKVIELNSHPHRLDLDWRWLRYALSQGVKISINPDAHDVSGLADVDYGVGIARKGGLTVADVINTLSLTEISEWLHL